MRLGGGEVVLLTADTTSGEQSGPSWSIGVRAVMRIPAGRLAAGCRLQAGPDIGAAELRGQGAGRANGKWTCAVQGRIFDIHRPTLLEV